MKKIERKKKQQRTKKYDKTDTTFAKMSNIFHKNRNIENCWLTIICIVNILHNDHFSYIFLLNKTESYKFSITYF